jgi:hypothetical protein
MTRIPAAWNTASNACAKLASRSCRTNFARVPASPRSMSRFRACWTTQDWTGCSVATRTRTRRLPCSITAWAYTFVPLSSSAVKKSGARIPCACDRGNSALPGPSRRDDPGFLEDLPYGRRRHARAILSTTDRTARRTGDRPERPCRDIRPQRRRTMSGCQRKIVAGVTISRTRPGARPAASRRPTPATPGQATSTPNEPSAARAGPPRADDAALVLPPRLPPRHARHRHRPGDDEEDQVQA